MTSSTPRPATIRPAPVRKSITVKAAAARAFEVFTGRIGSWWPRSHCIGSSPQKDVVLEPHAGGRWFEIGADGAQCNWGKVLAWEPPTRLLIEPIRTMIDSENGWTGLLKIYAAAAETDS